MRRGFLNSKKATHAANAELPVAAPPKQQPSTPAGPKESRVGDLVIRDDIPANSRASEPYSVIRIQSLTLTKLSSTCIIRASTCGTIMKTGFYTPPPMNPTNRVFTKNTPDIRQMQRWC